MAKGNGQRLKALYILKILQENSDEKHLLKTQQIIRQAGRLRNPCRAEKCICGYQCPERAWLRDRLCPGKSKRRLLSEKPQL